MVACGRDLERRLADINQKVVEAERKLREAESSSPDMSSSEKVCLPVNCTGRCVSPSLASHTVSLHKGVLLKALKHLVCRLQGSGELGTPERLVPEPGAEWVDVGSPASFGLPDSPTHLATPGEGSAEALPPMHDHSDTAQHLLHCCSLRPKRAQVCDRYISGGT